MDYKLKLLLLQWIESIRNIKKIKTVQTDIWNYDNISLITSKKALQVTLMPT